MLASAEGIELLQQTFESCQGKREDIDWASQAPVTSSSTLVFAAFANATTSRSKPSGEAAKMETIDSHPQEPATNAGKSDVWKRGLIMLVFIFLFGVGQSILYLIAVIQFLWLLFANEPNRFLVDFGKSLALWRTRIRCCRQSGPS